MQKDLVSIVVPVYNVEKYIRECLDSLINQSYNNIEIILIDDGSSDDSASICKEYCYIDDRITYIRQENAGAAKARNMGISLAKGKYLYTCDSDDILDKNAIKKLTELANQEHTDFIFFNALAFHNDETVGGESTYIRSNSYAKASGKMIAEQLLINGEFKPGSPLAFYKTSFLKENKIEFYPGIICEDELFSFYTYIKAETVRYCPEIFYYRRLRSGSVMTSNKVSYKKYCSLLKILNEMIKYCDTNGDYSNASRYFRIRIAKSAMLAYRNLTLNEKLTNNKEYKNFISTIRKNRGFGDYSLILRTYSWTLGLILSKLGKMARKL